MSGVEGVDYGILSPTDMAIFNAAFWRAVQGAQEVDGREFYIDEDDS